MNEELITKFLDGIGTKNDTVAILKEPTEGLDVQPLIEEFKADSRSVYSNDPAVIKELELKAKGKERGSVERKVKKVFNISAEEWAAAELDGDYEKALAFALDKQKKAGTKSVQEINTELQDANTKIEWYKNEEIPRIEKESSEKVDRNEANRHLRKLIADSGELIVSESATIAVVKEELTRKGYITGLNEAKTDLTIKTQEGLSPQDEGKTRNLTNDEVVKGILEGEKLVKQSRATTEPPKPTSRFIQTDSVVSDIPGLSAAEKNLADVQGMEKKSSGMAGIK
ncbi:MAG: hypothetical protein ACTSRU_20615 [Candidatus Hodarchaeales archaeon]